jgi:hypothetical protein
VSRARLAGFLIGVVVVLLGRLADRRTLRPLVRRRWPRRPMARRVADEVLPPPHHTAVQRRYVDEHVF